MAWLTLLGVCGLLIWKTEAFPDGAGDSACVTMQPGHYGTNASETPPEYVIKVSASTYCPGGSLQGTIRISLFVYRQKIKTLYKTSSSISSRKPRRN